MHEYKQFNIKFVCTILLGIIVLMLVNYVIDPFNIFHTKFFTKQFQQNERFNKAEFLEFNSNQYNSYILGSSRIGTTEPVFIERYIPETKFYNYYVSGATMYDNLENLKFIVSKGTAIKNIYLQVDILEMLTTYTHPSDNYLFRYAPHVLNTNSCNYKITYLTIAPYMNIVGKIRQNIKEDFDYARVDFLNSGCWYREAKENALKRDPEGYVKAEPSFHIAQLRNIKDIHLKENLEALKKIVNICKEDNIKLIIFTTPHNHRAMDSIETSDYLKVLKSLGEINDYWDFTGYNTITNDDINYYETSHYRPHVAQMIAARIFYDNSIKQLNDFGIWVTSKNVDMHIENRRLEVLKHDEVKSL